MAQMLAEYQEYLIDREQMTFVEKSKKCSYFTKLFKMTLLKEFPLKTAKFHMELHEIFKLILKKLQFYVEQLPTDFDQ